MIFARVRAMLNGFPLFAADFSFSNLAHVSPSPHASPEAVARVLAEFREMRGFSPTLGQAARLFHVTPEECHGILDTLVANGLLEIADGRYRLPRERVSLASDGPTL